MKREKDMEIDLEDVDREIRLSGTLRATRERESERESVCVYIYVYICVYIYVCV